jgi:hypothetical protein
MCVAPSNRTGGGGLSLRTLVIASAASLTAAMVTSRLFPPGTIYASALTPIIVTAVSEMLNRPAERVSELRRQRRTLVVESRRFETARIRGGEASPLQGAPEFSQGFAATEELGGNGSGEMPPIHTYGRRRRRILHPRVWVATGLAAFVIAIAALTLPELIFGGAVATSHRTTFFGGGGSHSTQTTPTTTTTHTTTTQTAPKTVTQTVPAQTPPSSQTTTTGTTTNGAATAPTESSTSTSTSPAPVPPAPTTTTP